MVWYGIYCMNKKLPVRFYDNKTRCVQVPHWGSSLNRIVRNLPNVLFQFWLTFVSESIGFHMHFSIGAYQLPSVCQPAQ